MLHDVKRAANGQGRFISRHSAEIMHFDDLCQRRFATLEGLEGHVQVEQLERLGPVIAGDFYVCVPRDASFTSATFRRAAPTCVVDQHLPHRPRHECQKMRSVRDVRLGTLKQLDERLVDQRCRYGPAAGVA
jgi:hypothetical protein